MRNDSPTMDQVQEKSSLNSTKLRPVGQMNQESAQLLQDLLMTPSPTGSEQRIQARIADRMRGVAERIETDLLGNLILGLNTSHPRRLMLAGHCDQLGFLVKYINKSGYLYLDPAGGHDYGVLLGEQLVIHTSHGPVLGIVGRKPIHLQSNKEMSQIPVMSRIWVDIGAKSREEAEKHVRLGDYVTVQLGVTPLLNGRISAPGLDNKAGLFVCLETLRRCANDKLNVALYVVSTVQEEIGSRGAQTASAAIKPEVGIAVDVVNATDDPSLDSPQQQVPCHLGGGPALSIGPGTNPRVGRMLVESADRLGIAHQPAPSGKVAGNDSQSIQTVGHGIATASVGIPQRNMHTQVEVCDMSDIESSIQLLVEFVRSLNETVDFRPSSDLAQ
jgi:putative aminopeptidase FrvX